MALTFGTLLSSQGADAHRSRPLGLSRGNSLNITRLDSRCQTGVCVPHHPSTALDHDRNRGSECWSPSRPAMFSGVRGVDHVRRAVAAESNPLPSHSGPGPGGNADSHQRRRSCPPASRRWSMTRNGTDLDRPRSRAGSRAGTAPTFVVTATPRTCPASRRRRAVGASGGLMLVTAAARPLRRPTSDPRPRNRAHSIGCSRRRAPCCRSFGPKRCPGYNPTSLR